MWFDYRAVEIDFLEKAPRSWSVSCDVPAPLPDVWRAYADPITWPEWFPGVKEACYRGDGPHGVGSLREALVGRHRFEEIMLAWDEGRRWAYTIERAELPLAHAQLECTDFEETADGTRLHWTIAADPRAMLKAAAPVFGRTMQSLFDRATVELTRYLATRA